MEQNRQNSKMNAVFGVGSPLTQMLQVTGELIILSFLWVLTSLPVITIGTSTSALYYAVVKAIRCKRGTPVREYFRAWKENLLKGCILTLFLLLCIILLYHYREVLTYSVEAQIESETISAQTGESALGLYMIISAAMVAVGILFIYVFPVLSRFNLGSIQILFLSFVMSVRYFYYTILLALMLLSLALLAYRIPASMMFVPGVWALISSRMIEKAMKKYLPEPSEGEDAWWMEV